MIKPYKNTTGNWCRECPICKKILEYRSDKNAKYYASHCKKSCKSCSITGKIPSIETKNKISLHHKSIQLNKGKMVNQQTRQKLRNKAANQPRRFGKAVDNGQIEMINKWNKLGFNFIVNYKLHTDDFLYFLDGYDEEKSIVLEYDSKYHGTIGQKEKDLIRQEKIINILKPKKFWRYDSVNKQFKNVIESVGY